VQDPGEPSEPATFGTHRGNAYSIFILVLTIQSLAIMVLILLPFGGPINDTLLAWDAVICLIFLIDFAYNVARSHPRRSYFIDRLGWLDLIGSIPTLGFIKWVALLRLARVVRLRRLARQLGQQGRRELLRDVIRNRGQYALFLTVLLAFIVLTSASVLVLLFESGAPDANITTGGDALWWAIVTITTVGYGDHYPVTTMGKLVAVVVMFSGIGIIGALASILAALLVTPAEPPPDSSAEEDSAATRSALEAYVGGAREGSAVAPPAPQAPHALDVVAALTETRAELAQTRNELAEIRLVLRALRDAPPSGAVSVPQLPDDG
jgi:voltage-gated potassium channel